MASLDAATASAVAALVVAIVALFVAFAQAIQQYLITGQLIRLCDSVVYGPMPGQGRRVWQFSQFRFRVIYSIPQISLDPDLWPSGGVHMKSHAIGEHQLPSLADADNPDATTLNSLRLLLALSARDLVKSGRRKILNWLRRTREQQPGLGSIDDLSEHNTSVLPVQNKFKLPLPLPAALRRRRPIRNPSLTSSSYQSSVMVENENRIPRLPRLPQLPQLPQLPRLPRLPRPISLGSGVMIVGGGPSTSSSDSIRRDPRRMTSHVGEASWVSFCRAIEIPCRRSVWIDFVEYDADRCPSDLISVPMQVSMRDIVIMALMAGMEITSASFNDKSISMQGAVGTLTSSNHAILGPILHFTPRNVETSLPMVFGNRIQDVCGEVNEFWMARTWDTCSVAGSFYNFSRRRTVRRLDDRWIRDIEGVEGYDLDRLGAASRRRKGVKADPSNGDELTEDKARPAQAVVRPRSRFQIPERRIQDGDWNIAHPPIPLPEPVIYIRPEQNRNTEPESSNGNQVPHTSTDHSMKALAEGGIYSRDLGTQETPATRHSGDQKNPEDAVQTSKPHDIEGHSPVRAPSLPDPLMGYHPPRRRATVEEVPDEDGTAVPTSSSKIAGVEVPPLLEHIEDDSDDEKYERHKTPPGERAKFAKERQHARAEKLRQIHEDKVVVDDVMKRGAMRSPYEEAAVMPGGYSGRDGRLLLTNYAHFPEQELPAGSEPTAKEEAAHEREKTREEKRRERDQARDERNRRRNRAVNLTNIDMFWLCQTDAMSGTWATPWRFHLPIFSALNGAVTVILEALLGFLDENTSLYYTGSYYPSRYSYERTARWMLQGNYTCPAYGQNARGGIIATGRYRGVHIPCFESMIPALELLHSYHWQVDGDMHDSSDNCEERNVELMRLDSWLSYVGRVPEIAEGPHNLLRQTPALAHLLMEEFEIDFQNIDLSAREGGLQDIQALAENMMDFLTDEELTQPEQLYVLVALLRGVKAAQCVLAGSDTTGVKDILLKDVQAHLV